MKKVLFYSLAVAAAMASCTQEVIEAPVYEAQDLSVRPTLGEIVLVENADIMSRFATGDGAQPVFSEGDKLGAAIMDKPLYAGLSTYDEENPSDNYEIVEYYSSNSAFTYDGSAWYLNEDRPLVEGNYMFYAPYNAAMQLRTPFEVAVPKKQDASTEKAALDEYYASGAVVRVGYQFLAAEGGKAQKPKVTMNDVFAYPMFTIKNNFEGYLQSLSYQDAEGNSTVDVTSYKGALKVDSIQLINGSENAIVVGGTLSNAGAANTMANAWKVSPMENYTAQLLAEDGQTKVESGDVITTLVAGGLEIAEGKSANIYAVMPAVKFNANELEAKVYVTINEKPYVIKAASSIAWSEVEDDSEETPVPVITSNGKYVSYASTIGTVTLIKGQRYPQEELNFINNTLSAKDAIKGTALTLDLVGGLLDAEDVEDVLGDAENNVTVQFAQEITVDGEDDEEESTVTEYIDNNAEFIAFISGRANGTAYDDDTNDFIFAANTEAKINSEMIDALFAYNNKGTIKIDKSLVIANDVEVVAVNSNKVTFKSLNNKQYTIELGTNYNAAATIVKSAQSVHVLKNGTWTISEATTLNNVKNNGTITVSANLSVAELVNNKVLNVTKTIVKGFENNGTVNVNASTAYVIVKAGEGEIVTTYDNRYANVSVIGGTQRGICKVTMTQINNDTYSTLGARSWINEWKLESGDATFTATTINKIPNRSITFHIPGNVKFSNDGNKVAWDMKGMVLCLEGTSDMTISGEHVEMTNVKNVTVKNETNYQVTLYNIAMGDAETESAAYTGLEGGLVADGITATWNGAPVGVDAEEALLAAIAEGGEVKLLANVTLTSALTITNEVTIDLNGKTIVSSASDAFEVKTGGKLTINGDNSSKVFADGNAVTSGGVCAVWANGGEVIINGGYFVTNDDANNLRNDCIYVKNGGKITINGGKFEFVGNNAEGHKFLLNSNDSSQGQITVNGGTFKNHAPSYEAVTSSSNTEQDVVLGTGKAVYNGETVVTTAHSGDTDVWYTVK